jgi:hypothetical protein
MKSTKIIYWIATIIFAGLMIYSSVDGIKPNEKSIQFLHDGLGYPIYFIQFISIAKLIGSLVILTPGLIRVKEWAYAGLFFDLAGAIYSGVTVGGGFDPMMLMMLIWIVPGIVSYICFHKLTKARFAVA